MTCIYIFRVSLSQVLDWLEKHGEQFLCKSIGVGRNLQKAYACQKSQDNFEKVVQVRIFDRFPNRTCYAIILDSF